MRIYLTQHGLAVSKDVDPERPLSEQGRLDVGRLASLLLVSDPDRPLLAFQPGSMACLEKDADGHWELAWMIRPELLALAGD